MYFIPDSLYDTSRELLEKAYDLIQVNYSQDGISPKTYHNLIHTQEVVESLHNLTEHLVLMNKVTVHEKNLLIIAGAFHDIVQNFGSGANESASAAIAKRFIQQTHFFTVADEAIVERLILATEVNLDNGIVRSAKENDYLAQLFADADLSALGRNTKVYWERAVGLLHEWHGEVVDTETELAFLEHQVKVLKNHTFYTNEAKKLFPHQKENLEYTLQKLQLLQ